MINTINFQLLTSIIIIVLDHIALNCYQAHQAQHVALYCNHHDLNQSWRRQTAQCAYPQRNHVISAVLIIIQVEGRMQADVYTDKEGKYIFYSHFRTKVVLAVVAFKLQPWWLMV